MPVKVKHNGAWVDISTSSSYTGTTKVAYVYDQKGPTVGGGAPDSTTVFLTRDLNTINDPNSIGITSTTDGVITVPAGTYAVEWSCPGHRVNQNQTQLVYDDNSSFTSPTSALGSSEYTGTANDNNNQIRSVGKTNVVSSSLIYLKVTHRCSSAGGGVGDAWGIPSNLGVDNIYTIVKIEDLKTAVKENSSGMTYGTKLTAYTLVATDNQKLITTDSQINVNQNIFSPADAITIYNNSGSNITISQGTNVTLRLVGSAVTGNRTLAARGIATIVCVANNEFVISGGGLS